MVCGIVSKARREDVDQILNLLHTFEKASGQQINTDKSSIFFSRNTAAEVKNEICDALCFQEATEGTSYLGLPNILGKNKSAVLGYLKVRVKNRIEGWDKSLLSKGGKELLLKTVAQSIPNYAMSMFLLPKQLCSDLERLMAKFWWKSSSNNDSGGIRWMSWERMCRSKPKGGLGFRQLYDFNVALLGRQGWRLITEQNSLASQIFKARYYPTGSFLTAKLGNNPSYIWRSILKAQVLLKKGAVRHVGNGSSVNITDDPWLPCVSNPNVETNNEAIAGKTVTSLMAVDNHGWDGDLIRDIFSERDANLIMSIPIRALDNDPWFWNREKLGFYSVKSAYRCLQEDREHYDGQDNSDIWKACWNMRIPQKIKIFVWRALLNLLPTKDQLIMRKVDVNPYCPVCNSDIESVEHILVACPFATKCWSLTNYAGVDQRALSFMEWMGKCSNQNSKEHFQRINMICWSLWRNRNNVVWNQKGMDPAELVESAKLSLNQWRIAQDKSFDNYLGFMTPADGSEQWKQPPEGTIKINTDAALFEESMSYAYAMIARDSSGDLIEARVLGHQGNIDLVMAEALGIREALSWVKQKLWFEVETDCLPVIQAIRCSSVNLSYLGRVPGSSKRMQGSVGCITES